MRKANALKEFGFTSGMRKGALAERTKAQIETTDEKKEPMYEAAFRNIDDT